MNLTDEERKIGKENFNRVTGANPNRRDFMKSAVGAAAAGGIGYGGVYYGYEKISDRLRVGIIGTGDEGNVLIGALNPEFIEVKAIADPRPYSQHRAFYGDNYSPFAKSIRRGLCEVYGWKDRNEAETKGGVTVYEDYKEMIAKEDLEAVIIATPLWLHDSMAIYAMQQGLHVLTEKLMGKTVGRCKEMARVAYATGKLLATGHQRHYSVLYDNAVDTLRRGVLGDIHHIRAQWHRNNLPGADSWQPPMPVPFVDEEAMKNDQRAARKKDEKAGDKNKTQEKLWKQTNKLIDEYYAWKKRVDQPKKYKIKIDDLAKWKAKLDQKRAQLEDIAVDAAKYDYEEKTLPNGEVRSPLEEMIRWRLWDRTGAGLMAELGSHQLDASGIFIASQFDGKQKVNPLSVVGVGHRSLFGDDREVDDHVYCMFEYPGKGYYENNDPKSKKVADNRKRVNVTYSSINGNSHGGYGEVVYGTKGTLILDGEQEAILFKRGGTTAVTVNKDDDLVDSSESGGPAAVAAAVNEKVSRGYREEIEHWAWCIKNDQPIETLHCHPKVALADAVIALTTNEAIKQGTKIDFQDGWFDPEDDAVPVGDKPRKAADIKV